MTLQNLKDYLILKQEQKNISDKLEELDILLSGQENPRIRENEIKLKEFYVKKNKELSDTTFKVEQAIRDLPSTYRVIMRLHYIDGLTWEAVAEKTSYSSRHIKRLHKTALEKMSLNVTQK